MLEFRWLLEELSVSFFAYELRAPQPVSIKRLVKAWGYLNHWGCMAHQPMFLVPKTRTIKP